jgi:PAS domain S-box-containing protein
MRPWIFVCSRALRAFVGIVVLTSACVPGWALASEDIRLAQFGIERWDLSDGLGSNWVRALSEHPDGTIWIGTGTGLVRFDGHRFEPIVAGGLDAFPRRAVTALAGSRDGSPWVGLDFAGVRRVGEPVAPALPDDIEVRQLLEDSAGNLWVGTARGLWRMDAGTVTQVFPHDEARVAEINGLATGPGGEIWVRSAEHGLWRIADDRIEIIADAPGCRGFGIAVGSDGDRFMSCREGIWHQAANSADWERIADDFGVGPILLDRRGDLWFGGRSGLTRWSKGRLERLPNASGLGDWRVRALTEDRSGDIWIGTFSGGLARLHRGPVTAFGAPEGLNIESATSLLAAEGGRLWIGSFRDGLLRFDPASSELERWTRAEGLPGDTAWSLAADQNYPGAIWVGADEGLARFDGRRLHNVGSVDGIAGAIRVLHSDDRDPRTLWLAGEDPEIIALRDGNVTRYHVTDGVPDGRVRFFHRDRQGNLLVGGEGGLARFSAGRWAPVTPGGTPLSALTAIAEDDAGVLWLASRREGLLRIDGPQSLVLPLDNGLPFWQVHSLALDRTGGLWMSGSEGLARLRIDDYQRWAAGDLAQIPVELFGRRDGMREIETNGWGHPTSVCLDGGRLAYPTARGILVLDPSAQPEVALVADEISLRGAWAGGRALPVSDPLQLTRQERALRISFSAVELLRPESVTFRYRLKGVDPDWIEAGTRRTAEWSPLPPGNRQLLLQARLPGQPWIDAAGTWTVSVTPQPWETMALRLTAFTTALALAAAVLYWRRRLRDNHAAALARTRTFLREVIDTNPNPMFVRGCDGAYILANRAAAEIYQRAPEDLEGLTPTELGPAPRGIIGLDAIDADVIASGEERVVPEHEIIDSNGQRRWFRVVRRPGYGPDARHIEHVIGTAVDITDFKLARERLEHEQVRLRRSREEARALSHQLLHAQEDERRRLAREIHDDITQQLAGLSMLAWSTAQAAIREPGGDRRDALEHLARGLEQLANDVQAMSRELHPPSLATLGLAAALRTECCTFAARTGLPIGFTAESRTSEPPVEVGLAFYRIAQEALRNCLSHARAKRVCVALVSDEGRLRLEIADDGVGFDTTQTEARRGIGLPGMRERARLAGASLRIDSTSGKGTRIVVEWQGPPRLE